MTEKQFEARLDSLILLKAILIERYEFDEVVQREYQVVWNKVFELLEEWLEDKKADK